MITAIRRSKEIKERHVPALQNLDAKRRDRIIIYGRVVGSK
jgi:hypothetical protein